MKQPTGETLNVNGSLTLDLNGHTITERLKRAGAIFTLASGAALTLSGDGRIVDTTGGDVAPYTFVVRGAGAAESSVVIAGGTVVFGGTVTNGWYDGNITFLNCGVTVNGGSLFARTRSTVIDSGSRTVNDGAVVDLGIRPTGGECLAFTDVTVNSGSLLLRGEDGFHGGTGDKKVNTMTINGGTVELRESDMGENPNGNGIFLTGGIKLNGGALRMGGLAGEGDTIAFSDAYTYAVEDMPGTYCGVTLTKSEAAALGNRWIAPLVASVTLNKTATTLTVGGTETLTATVVPSGALDRRVGWSSSNEGVATVDANGKVTAVKAGTATITVKTADGSKTATCTVTVMGIVSASVSGTKLTYSLAGVPAGAKLIAAWYDGSGKMLGMASASPTKGNSTGTLTVGTGAAKYKLMLVDGSTYAPLCEAMIADYS